MNTGEVKQVIESHRKWLARGGGERADLRYADLSYADLSYADLRYADLSSADLRSANLRYADLRYADLSSADLSSADLRYADLRYANLRYANLSSADLRYANLRYADLRYANLNGTGICYAELGAYSVVSHPDRLTVGCQSHDHAWWYRLTFGRAASLDNGAWDWWVINRDICFAMMRASERVGYPATQPIQATQ